MNINNFFIKSYIFVLRSKNKDALLAQSSLSTIKTKQNKKNGMTLQNDEVHAVTTVEQAVTSTTNGKTFKDRQRGGLQSCGQTGENLGRTVMYPASYPRIKASTSNPESDSVSCNKTRT